MKKYKYKIVSPNIYTKKYYQIHSRGFKNILAKIKPYIFITKGMRILDLGSGSGDLSIYLGKHNTYVIGIDYSKKAIQIAKNKLNTINPKYKKNIIFKLMDANNLDFEENYFDYVISIDFFEHIDKRLLKNLMDKISYVLKPGGKLLVHTEPNKIYLDFTHRFYIYPVSTLLIYINYLFTKNDYSNFSKDPRNKFHKEQHVNEPNYLYLKNLFSSHIFKGKIITIVPYKPKLSWKDLLFNIVVLMYPVSSVFPLNLLFAYDYLCVMVN